MTRYGLTLTTLTALATSLVAHAQTSQTAGAVRGTVVSKSGKAVQGALVVLKNRETGFTRRTTTDPKGSFLYSLVPVGGYDLTVTADGLQPSSAKNLQVTLGEAAAIQFKLAEVTVASEVVDVVAAPSGIDATQVSASASIKQELFEAIPVSGRNFTDLVQMTPGAAVNSQGYRTSVEGARGTMNNLQIDGASFNSKFVTEQRGGTRVPFSFGMDTIRELQVITNAYDAQYGDAAGAIINAVTKGGTNEVMGSAMLLSRPESMVARVRDVPYDRFGTTNVRVAQERRFSQTQANFNIGGPLIKDKLFYFVGAEAYRYKQDNTPAMGVPGEDATSSGNKFADYTAFMAGLGKSLIVHPDGSSLAQEAVMPWTNDIQNLAVFARLDWNINQDHRAYFRVNSQNYSGENNVNSQARTTSRSRSNNSNNTFRTLSMVAELSSVLTPNLVNEARIQVSDEERPFTPNSTVSSEFNIGGVGFGNYYIDPRKTNEQIVQFVDNMSLFLGDWTVKGGVNLQSTQMQNRYLPNGNGGWSMGSYGWANQWALGAAGAYTSTTVGTGQIRYSQSVSPLDGTLDFGVKSMSGYLNVQYQGLMEKRLMLSFGLRYTKESWDENPNPNPKLAGLDRMPDTSNVDPRLGFSLDLFGNARTVIRGGYGHFTMGNAGQTVSSGVMNNGINLISYSVFANSSASSSYQSLFKTGILSYATRVQNGSLRPLSAAEIAGNPLFSSSVTVTPLDPDAKMAQARRMSLGVEQMLPNGFKLGFTAKYAKFYNMGYAININLRQQMMDSTGKLVDDPNAFYNDGYPSTLNRFFINTKVNNRPGKAIVRGRLLDLTGYGDVFLGRYDGKGDYKAALVELSRHQENSFGFNLSLTLAESRDSNSNEVGTLNNNFTQPFDLANPTAVLTPSDNDIRFRGVLSVYTPPIFGFKVSGLIQYQTGRPYTPGCSGDPNGDGNTVNDINPEIGGRNSYRQPSARYFDLRISRPFTVGKRVRLEGIVDVYNVFNWANFTTGNRTASSYKYDAATGAVTYTPNAYIGLLDNPDARTREVQFTLKARF